MKLSNKLNNSNIIVSLHSNNKHQVLEELLNHFISLNYLSSSEKLLFNLDKKQEAMSAASGRGISYHYSTSIEVDSMIAVLGISKNGINYNATDGLLCNFILLILEPVSKDKEHRNFINYFQDLITNLEVKEQLLEAKNSLDVENIIKNWENNFFASDELL